MEDHSGGHVVAACVKASMKVPATGLISASYSTHRLPSRDLYDRYGLYKVPTVAGWRKAHALA